MKETVSGDLKSVFIESEEISYVRIDSQSNIVIILQKPKRLRDKTVIGYRGKLIGDPTARFGSTTGNRLNLRRIYEEEMNNEEKIFKEGRVREGDFL